MQLKKFISRTGNKNQYVTKATKRLQRPGQLPGEELRQSKAAQWCTFAKNLRGVTLSTLCDRQCSQSQMPCLMWSTSKGRWGLANRIIYGHVTNISKLSAQNNIVISWVDSFCPDPAAA